jgi:hypothetical protein
MKSMIKVFAFTFMMAGLGLGKAAAESVVFERLNYEVPESSPTAIVIAKRVDGSTNPLTVNYKAQLGNCAERATEDVDYKIQGNTVLFTRPNQSKAILISIIDDQLAERTECFNVMFTTPSIRGVNLGGPARVDIIDNDNACFKRGPSPDRNGDKKVDLTDFNFVRNDFGKIGQYWEGDANCDGKVDLTDFNIVKNAFGKPIR